LRGERLFVVAFISLFIKGAKLKGQNYFMKLPSAVLFNIDVLLASDIKIFDLVIHIQNQENVCGKIC
jgi:hypothetical protein